MCAVTCCCAAAVPCLLRTLLMFSLTLVVTLTLWYAGHVYKPHSSSFGDRCAKATPRRRSDIPVFDHSFVLCAHRRQSSLFCHVLSQTHEAAVKFQPCLRTIEYKVLRRCLCGQNAYLVGDDVQAADVFVNEPRHWSSVERHGGPVVIARPIEMSLCQEQRMFSIYMGYGYSTGVEGYSSEVSSRRNVACRSG